MHSQTAKDRIEFLRRLRSVREFTGDPMPQEVIDDILEVGRWSGSSMNQQPWEFILIHDRQTLQRLGSLEGYVKHIQGAAFGIAVVMEGRLRVSEAYDEGRLTERMMLAAAAHGVGSCMGWFAGEGVRQAKELLGVPEERTMRGAISFGYPAGPARRTRGGQARKPLEELVHEERYGQRRQ